MHRITPLLCLLMAGCPAEPVDTGPVGVAPVAMCVGPHSITPLGREVVFDATGTTDADGDELTFSWYLDIAPEGNLIELQDANTAIARFTPELQGDYGVLLTVSDSEGLYSEACRTSASVFDIPAPPRDIDIDVGLRIELNWDNERDDLDLHLLRPGGVPGDAASGDACFYATCANGYGTLEWGSPTSVLDNAVLIEDDVFGFGPEVIYLQEPEDLIYTVVVHDYQTAVPGDTTATIEVFWNGDSVFIDERVFPEEPEGLYIWAVDIDPLNGTYTAITEQPPQP